MREARIWREEHRNPTMANGGGGVNCNQVAAGDKSGAVGAGGVARLRGAGGAPVILHTVASESTSGMDATAMATWGGDSDDDDEGARGTEEGGVPPNGETIDDVEYLEDVETVPSVVSSKSSRAANKRFLATSSCSGKHDTYLSARPLPLREFKLGSILTIWV